MVGKWKVLRSLVCCARLSRTLGLFNSFHMLILKKKNLIVFYIDYSSQTTVV